jgi:hypothetical protein
MTADGRLWHSPLRILLLLRDIGGSAWGRHLGERCSGRRGRW